MLPKIDVPTYEIELPSDKQKIRFRPFLVKEQKLFLIAAEAKEVKDMIGTIKQVISNCIIEPKNININALPVLDIEYLFVQLRARSMGETIKLEFVCQNNGCNTTNPLHIDLLEVEVERNPENNKKITLTESIGVVMKYPNFSAAEKLMVKMESQADVFDSLIDCIDYIYDGETIFYAKNETRKDLIDWLESLSNENIQKIRQFINTIPSLVYKTKFNCSKCGYSEDLKLEGIQSFFQ